MYLAAVQIGLNIDLSSFTFSSAMTARDEQTASDQCQDDLCFSQIAAQLQMLSMTS